MHLAYAIMISVPAQEDTLHIHTPTYPPGGAHVWTTLHMLQERIHILRK
jgi:hypothetical protein